MSKEITSQNSEVQEISELQDYTLRSTDAVCVNESHLHHKWYYNFKYLAVGILFGIVFVKAEIISSEKLTLLIKEANELVAIFVSMRKKAKLKKDE